LPSVEEPELVPSKKSLLKKTSPKLSLKPPSVDTMPTKQEEKTSPISKDSKSSSSEEDSLNYSEPSQKHDSPLYLNISIFNLIIFISISIFMLIQGYSIYSLIKCNDLFIPWLCLYFNSQF